ARGHFELVKWRPFGQLDRANNPDDLHELAVFLASAQFFKCARLSDRHAPLADHPHLARLDNRRVLARPGKSFEFHNLARLQLDCVGQPAEIDASSFILNEPIEHSLIEKRHHSTQLNWKKPSGFLWRQSAQFGGACDLPLLRLGHPELAIESPD